MNEPVQLVEFADGDPITVGTIVSTSVLDMTNVMPFGEQVTTYVAAHPGIHLLLNFENVTYMASSALTELLRINDAVVAVDGSMRLCNLSRDMQKVFEITNLNTLFVIHDEDTVDKAKTRFERSLAVAAEEDAWAGE
jgi:anti-anti-sigma factor